MLEHTTFYLVGIKGVAMTAMAELLLDAGKTVYGSDLAEDFVTQPILDKLGISIDTGFTSPLPASVEVLIYTAAHQGVHNPQVQAAQKNGIVCLSQAEALAEFFNQKKGIAVCGVGGKSTVSAMISWIFEKTNRNPSYAVGVGQILGLEKTAQWNPASEYFIAEADEYVTDPSARKQGIEITPRFSYLKPHITVCTNIKFDHPDVYTDFDHTLSVFTTFFNQIDPQGTLLVNENDAQLVSEYSAAHLVTFGKQASATFCYAIDPTNQQPGKNAGALVHETKSYPITLKIPGEYNLANATAAIAGAYYAGIPIEESIQALATFASTQRRFEYIGEKNGVQYYDDYAHHPNEIYSVIKALKTWYPTQNKIIAFQPHTYSRTKQLLHEFVHSFKDANSVYLLDIFASAREESDPTITSDILCELIKKSYPNCAVENVHTVAGLAQKLKETTQQGDVVITLGAGDIYKAHNEV